MQAGESPPAARSCDAPDDQASSVVPSAEATAGNPRQGCAVQQEAAATPRPRYPGWPARCRRRPARVPARLRLRPHPTPPGAPRARMCAPSRAGWSARSSSRCRRCTAARSQCASRWGSPRCSRGGSGCAAACGGAPRPAGVRSGVRVRGGVWAAGGGARSAAPAAGQPPGAGSQRRRTCTNTRGAAAAARAEWASWHTARSHRSAGSPAGGRLLTCSGRAAGSGRAELLKARRWACEGRHRWRGKGMLPRSRRALLLAALRAAVSQYDILDPRCTTQTRAPRSACAALRPLLRSARTRRGAVLAMCLCELLTN